MPTAVGPQISLKSSFSTAVLTTSSKHEIKTKSRIESAQIVSFEKRQDQKIWYTIRIQPEKQVKAYLVGRRYDDFIQLSQKLYDMSKGRAKSPLPPKIKSRINLLPVTKQLLAQRVDELNHFLSCLLQKQHSILMESFVIFEFFGIHKSDLVIYEKKLGKFHKNQHFGSERLTCAPPSPTTSIPFPSPSFSSSSASSSSSYSSAETTSCLQHQSDANSSRWKRLRCTSFLAKSVPTHATATHLSSLCSQAANKIMPSWNRNYHAAASPRPSLSTPTPHDASTKAVSSNAHRSTKATELKKSKSSLCIITKSQNHHLEPLPVHPLTPVVQNDLQSPVNSIASSHLSTNTAEFNSSSLKTTIKFKVIYNADNIVVIQVSRTITLNDLRVRIQQKFSDTTMGNLLFEKEMKLVYNDNSSSWSSMSSDKPNEVNASAVVLNSEQDLNQIMQAKWNRLEKVTLRCIV
ncbi:hypothetical protein BD560DRAFT_412305 [Blakeslea trispora]|nr:hypothetical protein BD560DRAFT_412305 [Blakeslea trispora]